MRIVRKNSTIVFTLTYSLYANTQPTLTLFISPNKIYQIMRNALLSMMSCVLFSSCFNYQKLDFHVSNQGFSYLDSLRVNSRSVALPYPIDAFRVAKPFFLKRYGARDYRASKPYQVKLVNDSTWEVWTNDNFYRELNRKSTGVGCVGVGISLYDGKIKYVKVNR